MGSLTFVCKHEGEVWTASAKEAEVSTSAASESEVKSECFNLAKEHLGSGFKVWSATIQPNKSVVFQGYFPVGGVAVAGGGGAAGVGGGEQSGAGREEKQEEEEEEEEEMEFDLFD